MCLKIGVPHPDYLDQYLTASQWEEWRAFAQIRPFGEQREELRHGQRMAQYANYHPYKDQKEPARAIDYMNYTERPEEKPVILTEEETQALIDKECFGI